MSIDGLEWDVPDTEANAAAFGYPGTGKDATPAAFPKARAVTIGECASHAPVLAAIGPCVSKGSGEQSLARKLYPRLEEDWLLIADRNFYNWQDWCTAADTGAALLWRVKADLTLQPLEFPGRLLQVRAGKPQDQGRPGRRSSTRPAPGRTWTRGPLRPGGRVRGPRPRRRRERRDHRPDHHHHDFPDAPARVLAPAYHERWEHETGNRQVKTYLRGPGKILRSQSPDMVKQEIWGYFLTHYAITALICTAATTPASTPTG